MKIHIDIDTHVVKHVWLIPQLFVSHLSNNNAKWEIDKA